MQCFVRTRVAPVMLALAMGAGFLVPTDAMASRGEDGERAESRSSRVWDQGGDPNIPRFRVARAYYGESDTFDEDEVKPRRRPRADGEFQSRPKRATKAPRAKRDIVRRSAPARTASTPRSTEPRTTTPSWSKRSLSTAGPRGSGHQGVASFYWQPQRVAAGGWFNPNAMTAAHKTLPFGTRVRVTHMASRRSVVVRINDRGPYIAGRIIDLSKAAAGVIGMTKQGIAKVAVEVLGR